MVASSTSCSLLGRDPSQISGPDQLPSSQITFSAGLGPGGVINVIGMNCWKMSHFHTYTWKRYFTNFTFKSLSMSMCPFIMLLQITCSCNSLLQLVHLNSLTVTLPWSLALWEFKENFWLNNLLHVSHLNFLSWKWTSFTWRFKSVFCPKCFSQKSQG